MNESHLQPHLSGLDQSNAALNVFGFPSYAVLD